MLRSEFIHSVLCVFASSLNGVFFREDVLFSKLTQLKERSDSLAGTCWQCQDPQFYNVLFDHQLQDKKDLIISTIAKSQETVYNHLLLISLSTVQQQGEMWNQRLQLHAGELAQALIQNSELEKDGKSRLISKAKEKGIIEKVLSSTVIVFAFFLNQFLSFKSALHKKSHKYKLYKKK